MVLTNMSTMNSLLPMQDEKRNLGSVEVPTTTLDHFCGERGIERVDILKMDIQGGERWAVAGAAELLTNHRVDLVYTEILFSRQYQGQTESYELYASLAGFGYTIFGLYNLRIGEIHQLTHCNAIFISPQLEHRLLRGEAAADPAGPGRRPKISPVNARAA